MLRDCNFQTKNIVDFSTDDTLYIQKTEGNYSHSYLVRFVEFSRGIVKGEIIKAEEDYLMPHEPKIISARLSRCYLFDTAAVWGGCRWFDKSGYADSSPRE